MLYGQRFPFFLLLAVWTAFGLTRSSRQLICVRVLPSPPVLNLKVVHAKDLCPSGDLKLSNQRRASWSVRILK